MEASAAMTQPHNPGNMDRTRAASRARGFLRDRRAASIVEFALITPIFLLVLGAAVDFGLAVRTKFKLSSALATASNLALNNASSVSTASEAALASTLATLIASANAANWASASVNVNNGSTASMTAGSATLTTGGSTSGASSCYCPTGSGTTFAFGTVATCGAACSGGAVAGKFVKLSASRAYTPMILPSRLINSPITASSVVQVQ